ncbi:CRISPR-associated protein Cas4 [Streptococcus pseudoporcinus]|uniref:CRISPR-associated exonuclease Cas4 n=1 Tax=Streptococcus pseudoporcinus LQ 940-04 TaxID=875093 RepID=G5K9U1_9STRE|nr:CRISPR-associated protein Cas4 [Streptococcus pseudoporcinus]EFR44845.1 CRISPR-associated protein Cas4 [Streptococcus pseudoporcinus SPIN 20026]EHI65003.1 CRISPR-associated protein Cas4 [Streptococcus pseudoporcinus LQ 940-04]VEF93465.1 CRISPR-associated protein Cas4 [Streptococcus pseudoporcinus]
MVYAEEDYLMLSGIQHFQFCKRQWALIHIEQQWSDNEATAHGQTLHQKADNPFIKEKRKDTIISRAIHISSKNLGLYGILDVLEFHRDSSGIPLEGRNGLWIPLVVEYKRGKPKKDTRDIVQLVAQVICLEETLGCYIDKGYLYYHSVNQKVEVDITEDLRREVHQLADQMHDYYNHKVVEKAAYFKNCTLCSLVDICMPRLSKKTPSVNNYINNSIISEVI